MKSNPAIPFTPFPPNTHVIDQSIAMTIFGQA